MLNMAVNLKTVLVAACALIDADGRVLIAERPAGKSMAGLWEFPGGKVEPGERPEQSLIRELKEETGTDKAEILGESRGWLHYDVPTEIAGRLWGGRYRGQRQKWFAMRFTGEDGDIDPAATEHPEFDAWEWVAPERLPELIVPFKRPLYLDVLAEFREHCRPGPR